MKKEVPKILWMLWFQGWENAPLLVKKCKETWIKHNPEWTIHFLTSETLSDFIDLEAIIPGYKTKNIRPESLSNIIRIALLLKYGGVWADSTLYCNKPLDRWLPESTADSGFFAFANPGPDRMLSSWFLAATPNHVIVQKWYDASAKYWSTRNERHTYFWFHYLFGDMYQHDEVLKSMWDQTPKISADGPHYYLPYEKTFVSPLTPTEKKVIDRPSTPVFKLTFKYDEQLVSDKSVLHYLLSDRKSTTENKTIIIIGMHRSGTSLTASLLEYSGLDIGTDLMGSATGNAHGHYENMDFYTFHMRMLEKLNYNVDGWDEAEIDQINTTDEEEAKNIIENNESALWGWKDPRTTLFINLWAKLLPDAHFLFVYRSPVEVIDSLYRRGTDPVIMENPERALKVWMHYNKLVLKNYKKFEDRSALIHVKSFINSYSECIKMINQKFNINLSAETKGIFDQGSFNKTNDTHILWGKLLYKNHPEVKHLYQELLDQSWHPSNKAYLHEASLGENKSETFNTAFFNQWKEVRAPKTQLNHTVKQPSYNNSEIIKEKEETILNLQKEIDWMKKTKFWKIREVWQKLKSSKQ